MKRLSTLLALSLLSAAFCAAQLNTLTQTSLSAAVAAGASTITVASATNIAVTSATSNGAALYIVDPGETQGQLIPVTSVSGTTIGVRGIGAHVSGASVLVGQPQWFQTSDPKGACVTANLNVTPILNTTNGRLWQCSSITLSYVPSWQNLSAPAGVTTLVASAASSIVPSGPYFHTNGTAAVTGFTNASMIGFVSGCFTTIPDAVFTWTAAGDIAVAGTAVVNRALTFCWDQTNSKWVPSYV